MKTFKNDYNPNKIFVYGANLAGHHGAGAAREAWLYWGAEQGQHGFNGRSYGIPTKSYHLQILPLGIIKDHVTRFLSFAKTRSDLTFLVTPIGTGLAKYKLEDIAPMFKGAPTNCVLAWEEDDENN